MADLAAVQGWMQRAIFGGGGRPDFAAEVVAGDPRLAPDARVGIYAGGYRARLRECLREEYPALRLFAGDTVFDLFAEDYITASPSRDPSLYAFGAGFADHLAARAPASALEAGSALAIPAQLARLERARGESIRAGGVERLALPVTADFALVPGARLAVPDSVRLLRLDFDFGNLIEAAEDGRPGTSPQPGPTCTAVARSAWRVRVHRIEPWRFAFLEALAAGDGNVHAAAAAAARGFGMEVGAALADLAAWLPLAGAAGLVARP
jgi:hypothetical protein